DHHRAATLTRHPDRRALPTQIVALYWWALCRIASSSVPGGSSLACARRRNAVMFVNESKGAAFQPRWNFCSSGRHDRHG
ncbi:hypothetical protein, partial [Bradyrhizobium sp. Mp19]|uniref:hypothetical protein n=1 Tax=Bradyrhizobium sp. Mp19 TaxID=3042156 RepID=UPI0024866C71